MGVNGVVENASRALCLWLVIRGNDNKVVLDLDSMYVQVYRFKHLHCWPK